MNNPFVLFRVNSIFLSEKYTCTVFSHFLPINRRTFLRYKRFTSVSYFLFSTYNGSFTNFLQNQFTYREHTVHRTYLCMGRITLASAAVAVLTVMSLTSAPSFMTAAAAPAVDQQLHAAVPPPPPRQLLRIAKQKAVVGGNDEKNGRSSAASSSAVDPLLLKDRNHYIKAFGCPFGGNVSRCNVREGCVLNCNPMQQDEPADACGGDGAPITVCSLLPFGWPFCATIPAPCGGVGSVGGYAPHVATSASVLQASLAPLSFSKKKEVLMGNAGASDGDAEEDD